ncbi:PilZ domain-containing protein [Cohnella sp. 56]|uniref:PilZ domain-containing protein n=1 Tax=Cohnella sp. 56 TaxID=3113722 RepID=UPI0030E9C02B
MHLQYHESGEAYGAHSQSRSGADRRRLTRLRLLGPVIARLHIVRLGNIKPELPAAAIELIDLSPEGCSFRTRLRLPVRDDARYRFEWQLEGILLRVSGQLCWSREEEYGIRYGVKFAPGIVETILLVRLLNTLILKTCPRQERIHRIYRTQLDKLRRR